MYYDTIKGNEIENGILDVYWKFIRI